MRSSHILILILLSWTLPLVTVGLNNSDLQRRQGTTNGALPTLTTDSPSAPTAASASQSSLPASVAATTDLRSSTASSQPNTANAASNSTVASHSSTAASAKPTTAAPLTNSTASSTSKASDVLPLQPRITPAFGIAGVFLILFGAVYALIGVKSRSIQIFLSCGFLASIATTALVDFVMSTPVSDAVQGGFFVAIFMTGAVFGGGALIFQEFTEGFGCLLGGFCFSMWLLVLKPGGLVTSPGGKGAFIGIFSLVAWSLSWTKYTRPYALIGSTAFGGATAFVLGLDCFVRAGMKEFWFYIWDLNDGLFPLNTSTYPLTRGIKVEIALIIIGTIIGLLSQIRLWKIIRSKQRKEEAVQQADSEHNQAIEAALGRHLERQNEREKSAWERQYGDRLNSKRNTILWQDARADKRYSTVSVAPIQPSHPSASAENLEMDTYGSRKSQSGYGSRSMRQSTVTVEVIPEADEDHEEVALNERNKALQALEDGRTSDEHKHSGDVSMSSSMLAPLTEREEDRAALSNSERSVEVSKPKRQSRRSSSGLTKRSSSGYVPVASHSKDHLVDFERPQSRASSAAATLDGDNEKIDVKLLDVDPENKRGTPPEIIISPVSAEGAQSPAIPSGSSTGFPGAESRSSDGKDESLGGASQCPAPPIATVASSSAASAADTKNQDRVPESQASEGTDSTTESLTRGALAQVPSQMSTVVLSYRTNEWAKHITSAEAPVYDEPESIEGVEGQEEAPTHLVRVATESQTEPPVPQSAAQTLQTEMVPPSVRASQAGVGVASQLPTPQRSFSDQELRRSTMKAPSRSTSMQSLKIPSHRASRIGFNPAASTSLVAMPIMENIPSNFGAPTSAGRRSSAPGSPYLIPTRRTSATSLGSGNQRPYSTQGTPRPHSGSPLYDAAQLQRLQGHQQQHERPERPSGTRMDSYESHQPAQRDIRKEAQKRESLLADWRLTQQQSASRDGLEASAAEHGRARLKMQLEKQRQFEEYQRSEEQLKQLAMDQMMRRPEMLDLHREAMRRMQGSANKKLRGSTG
ncbi:hypothetical protein PV08_01151 [Exophiala spinifera]|uniref:TM7S3/TM198-like domain-containing protein n=1 Tax=Exophiala spinifera TaxID=91928 RepID=A0A0D1YZ76_9EURO|nr:uncharacterized protein PV08_01151 [Exophiala spinifera]KIW20576.1 hypothetical protein PV08_01151 [Exophiala spinifera]